ncbi:MAG: hypothetical protein ACREO8_05640 [Luteimonas sp.]
MSRQRHRRPASSDEVAKTANGGDMILAMLPDTGERYLSTSFERRGHGGSE